MNPFKGLCMAYFIYRLNVKGSEERGLAIIISLFPQSYK